MHDLGADPPPLQRRIHEKLRQEECAFLCGALQPADIGAVERDDPNLRCVPLAAEAGDLRVSIQFQLPDDVFHFGEVKPRAIVEVRRASAGRKGSGMARLP